MLATRSVASGGAGAPGAPGVWGVEYMQKDASDMLDDIDAVFGSSFFVIGLENLVFLRTSDFD